MIQGATQKSAITPRLRVRSPSRSLSGVSFRTSSIAPTGEGAGVGVAKSRVGLISGDAATPSSPRTFSDGKNERFSCVEKRDDSHNLDGIYLFDDENVMMLCVDIELPFLIGEKLGSGASASVYRVDLLIPRFTTLALTGDGRLPDLDDQNGLILNVLPKYDENLSDSVAIEYIKSGLVYALKVVHLSSVAPSKAAERRAIVEYEIRLLEQLRSSLHTRSLCVRIFGSEILENEIVILLELAQCDLGSWLFSDSGGAGAPVEAPLPDRDRDGERDLNDGDDATASAMRLRPLSPWQILDIWTQLVHAVEAIHAANVIHFDIKPKNILVIKENYGDSGAAPLLKLADFGLARQLQGSKSHISADGGWGTLKYMAPEVIFQPSWNFEFRNVVDVWSIGIILHQLLHDGRTPHEFLGNGRVRLAVGIVDQRAFRPCREADWIVSALPPADRPEGILLRDFFLATQEVCLTHDESTRARASDLKHQLSALKDALEHLKKSGSVHEEEKEEDADGVSAVIDCRPELKTLFARTVRAGVVAKGTRVEKSSPSGSGAAIQMEPPVAGGMLNRENQSSTVSSVSDTVIARPVEHDDIADRASSFGSKGVKHKCDGENAGTVGATSPKNLFCDPILTGTDDDESDVEVEHAAFSDANTSSKTRFTSFCTGVVWPILGVVVLASACIFAISLASKSNPRDAQPVTSMPSLIAEPETKIPVTPSGMEVEVDNPSVSLTSAEVDDPVPASQDVGAGASSGSSSSAGNGGLVVSSGGGEPGFSGGGLAATPCGFMSVVVSAPATPSGGGGLPVIVPPSGSGMEVSNVVSSTSAEVDDPVPTSQDVGAGASEGSCSSAGNGGLVVSSGDGEPGFSGGGLAATPCGFMPVVVSAPAAPSGGGEPDPVLASVRFGGGGSVVPATLLPNELNRQALQNFFESTCNYPSTEAERLSNECGNFTMQQVQSLWEFFYHKKCAGKFSIVMAKLEKISDFGLQVGVCGESQVRRGEPANQCVCRRKDES